MLGAKIPITKELLEKLLPKERALLLGMWHVANELSAIEKMILHANNSSANGPIEEAGRSMNSWLLIKLFSAKAWEGWKFYKVASEFPEFARHYQTHEVARDLAETTSWLDQYFGTGEVGNEARQDPAVPARPKNVLKTVRNKSGSHYDYDLMLKTCNDLEGLDSFVYVTDQQGNSLYWAAEEVAAKSIQSALPNTKNLKEFIETVADDVHEVTKRLGTIAQIVGVVAVERALETRPQDRFPLEPVAAYQSADIKLPFFVDFSGELARADDTATSASADRNRSSARPG